MFKKSYFLFLLLILIFSLSACSMSFGQPEGPDSGDEIDIPEPSSPDSGDEIDTSEPTSPDSGDEIDTSESTSPDSGEDEDNQGPDSGDEIDANEPTSPDSGDEIDPNEPTSPDSGDEISLNEDLKNRAKGSCNAISEGSTCVEYIGSFWTEKNASLNCSGHTFSLKPCPRPALGGCRIGADSANEIVTWHYDYGGDPYTEALPYAVQACNALSGARWIN